MVKKNKKKKKEREKNQKKEKNRNKKEKKPLLELKTKYQIIGILCLILGVIILFSFYKKAGIGGETIFQILNLLIGKIIFLIPLLFVISAFIFFLVKEKKKPLFLGILILLIALCGLFEIINPDQKSGGILGYYITWAFLKIFGSLVTFIIFISLFIIALLLLGMSFLKTKVISEIEEKKLPEIKEEKKRRAIFEFKLPKFNIKKAIIKKKLKEETIPIIKETKKEKEFVPKIEEYKTPPLELLSFTKELPLHDNIENNSLIIQKTLANFGIEVEMGEINIGPTVTQYSLKPADGIKLSRITSLNNDLALALAAHPLRIEAPIPGKSLVGIEVPNRGRAIVNLRELLVQPRFQTGSTLTFCLGKNVSGTPLFTDLEKMPHLLVAGSTGSGKTIFLQILILSLIFRSSPQLLKLILIDPKRVEFPVYSDLPHLLTPVIYNVKKTIQVLNWLIGEMERRFELLSELKVRDIQGFNKVISKNPKLKEEYGIMSFIVLIIDELADLMAAKGRELEAAIVRLSQMARATGIHLVVATQRPSVDVITGLIKANLTSRIAFQVATQTDSRTVLDMAGAEKLLGQGDMLFISSESGKPRRIQGCWVNQHEVKKVIDYIKKENKIEEEGDEIKKQLVLELTKEESEVSSMNYNDPLYQEAKKIVLQYRKASASLLQRRLKVGYARAARLLDILEEKGIIGSANGAKPREVFLVDESPDDKNFNSIEEIKEDKFEDEFKKDEDKNEWYKI